MNHIVKIAVIGIVIALAGCASHHQTAKEAANQAAKNGVAAMYGGGPVTSNTPSLANYTP